MGNVCHVGEVPCSQAASAAIKTPPKRTAAPLTFGRDPTLKPEDYRFDNMQEQLLVKMPGSIKGQQFLLDNCTDCHIFLLDHCTNVQIDNCKNCKIVVGPCESSLFLRNCSHCTLVCAVQQFRTRDCENIDVHLFSITEPIIETSSSMRFACFPLAYFSLQEQFEQAKFSVWNNRWSEVYNFTPDHGTWQALSQRCHESPLAGAMQKQEDGGMALWKLPSWTVQELGMTIAAPQLVVPLTSGVQARREEERTLVVVFVVPQDQLMIEFAQAMTRLSKDPNRHPPLLIRTRQLRLTEGQARELIRMDPRLQAKAAEASKTTTGSVVMQFQGVICGSRLSHVLQEPRFASDPQFTESIFASVDEVMARWMGELVFVDWKECI